MENKGMLTDIEVLNRTIEILNSIKVPVKQMEEIGYPIMQSIDNLNAVVEAIQNARNKENAEKADEGSKLMEVMPPEDETQEEENADAE